jgi:protein TonB
MRKDLIIGIVISLMLHGGILYGEKLFHMHFTVAKHAKVEEEKLIQMEMPPPDEPEHEEVHELNDEPVQNQLAPPSLVDLPTTVDVRALQQPMQPPPPPGLTAAKGAITIPVVKPGSQFGKGMKDLFNLADLDQHPQAIAQIAPDYPYEMKRAGISGEVTAQFIVDSNGSVVQVQIIKTSQHEFEDPVTRALYKWKFRPGKKGGRAVNTKMEQTFPFVLKDE